MSEFVIIEGIQYHKLSEWPTGLKSAEETAQMVGVDAEKLIKQAEARQVPHYRFDGGPPRFRPKEVKEWMLDSGLAYRVPGERIKHQVINYNMPPEGTAPLPRELVNLKGLRDISNSLFPSGVYFLVDGDELVYIGQSVNPIARIGSHVTENRKQFTHAFLLPVPEDQLDNVEGALIRFLDPRYNSKQTGAPRGNKADEEVLEEVGI